MIENDAPKLCKRLHSRPSSCVYPNSARRPSSWILKLRSEGGMAGCARCSVDKSALSALNWARSCLLVRKSDLQNFFISLLLLHPLVRASTSPNSAKAKEGGKGIEETSPLVCVVKSTEGKMRQMRSPTGCGRSQNEVRTVPSRRERNRAPIIRRAIRKRVRAVCSQGSQGSQGSRKMV